MDNFRILSPVLLSFLNSSHHNLPANVRSHNFPCAWIRAATDSIGFSFFSILPVDVDGDEMRNFWYHNSMFIHFPSFFFGSVLHVRVTDPKTQAWIPLSTQSLICYFIHINIIFLSFSWMRCTAPGGAEQRTDFWIQTKLSLDPSLPLRHWWTWIGSVYSFPPNELRSYLTTFSVAMHCNWT